MTTAIATRYAVVRTADMNGSYANFSEGRQVPTPEGVTNWLYSYNPRRGSVRITSTEAGERPDYKPLTWATRETAQRVADTLTSDFCTYAVVEVDVVAEYPSYTPGSDGRAYNAAMDLTGAWHAVVGPKVLVMRLAVNVNA